MKEILWFALTRQCCLMGRIQPFLQVKQPKRWVLWHAQQREESKLSEAV
jgi:hypothetical protein